MKIKFDTSIHVNDPELQNITKRKNQRPSSLCVDVVANNKDRILILRRQGFSWKEISGLLNISVTSLRNAISAIMTNEELLSFSRMKKNIGKKPSISKRDQYSKYQDVEIVLKIKEGNVISLAIR